MEIFDKQNVKIFSCDTCIINKMSQTISRKPDARANKPFELIHADLAGPIDPMAKGNFKYVIAFTDDYSSIIFPYFLKCKADAYQAFEKFIADVAPLGKILRLRSDNGGEFISKSFKSVAIKNNIRQEFSAPKSPHQNGTAERMWRTISEMAKCLIN